MQYSCTKTYIECCLAYSSAAEINIVFNAFKKNIFPKMFICV